LPLDFREKLLREYRQKKPLGSSTPPNFASLSLKFIDYVGQPKKVELKGAWMPEKSFAATPFSCRDAILDKHVIMRSLIDNCITASGKIVLKLKDFEGIYVP